MFVCSDNWQFRNQRNHKHGFKQVARSCQCGPPKIWGNLILLCNNNAVYSVIHFSWHTDLQVKSDHRSKLSNLSNWKEAWKKSGLQQDSNPWPPRYRCDALPTELWSHTLGARSICWVHISREEWNGVKHIWNNSYVNCGGRSKWRMIIAVNFPI